MASDARCGDPAVVQMPGQVCGVAAGSGMGPLFATSHLGADARTIVLSALDLDTTLMWQRTFAGRPARPRVASDGTVWISHHGPDGPAVIGLRPDGSAVAVPDLDRAADETIGALVVLPDGFYITWLALPPGAMALSRAATAAVVARHDLSGRRLWSTPIPLATVSHPSVLELSEDGGWRPRQKPAWTPEWIEASHRDPLLVSGDRIAATVVDGRSGLGATYFLDTDTGGSSPAPTPARTATRRSPDRAASSSRSSGSTRPAPGATTRAGSSSRNGPPRACR